MLLLASLEQFDIQLADFFIVLATFGLVLYITLASLCAPLVAVATEIGYGIRKKAFLDKCAMQISQSALVNAIFILFAFAAGAWMIISQTQPELLEPPFSPQPAIIASPIFAALLLLLLYTGTWQALKKVRPLHILFGLLAALLFLGSLFLGCLLAANIQQPMLFTFLWSDPLVLLQTLLADFLTTPPMWAMVGYLFCTGVVFGMALAQIWLILRRQRADFGRDYYAFAMQYCARIALMFTVFSTALVGGVYWLLRQSTPPELSQPHDPGILLIAAGLPLCCCLLWLVIVKSSTPMRHKPGVVFGLVFSYVALCAQILMLMTTFPLI